MKLLFALLTFVVFFSIVSSLSHKHKKIAEKSEHSMEHNQNLIRHWPHLEGVEAAEAEASIKRDRPGLKVYKLPQNSAMTMDYREDRVRIFVDESGKVVGKPTVG